MIRAILAALLLVAAIPATASARPHRMNIAAPAHSTRSAQSPEVFAVDAEVYNDVYVNGRRLTLSDANGDSTVRWYYGGGVTVRVEKADGRGPFLMRVTNTGSRGRHVRVYYSTRHWDPKRRDG